MGDPEQLPILSSPDRNQYDSLTERIPTGSTSSRPSFPRNREDTILKRVPGLKKTVFGKFKGFDLLEREEWLFLCAGILSIITTLSFTIFRLVTMAELGPDSDDMLLGIIFLVNTLFTSYYLLHGVSRDQYFDTVTFLITTLVVIGYVFLNYFGMDESQAVNNMDIQHPSIKMARLIVTCILGFPVLGLGVVVVARYWRSNYMLFRLVGARTDLQAACSNVLITHTLISLAVNAAGSFLIATHYLKLLEADKTSILIFSGGIAFVLLWAILGYVAVRFESTPWTIIFIVLALLQPAYAIYETFQIRKEDLPLPHTTIRFGAILISCGVLAASVLMIVVSAFYAIANYGKGLYERMYGMDDEETWRVVTSRPEALE